MILNLGFFLNQFVVVVNDTTTNNYDTDNDIIMCCTLLSFTLCLHSLSPHTLLCWSLYLSSVFKKQKQKKM